MLFNRPTAVNCLVERSPSVWASHTIPLRSDPAISHRSRNGLAGVWLRSLKVLRLLERFGQHFRPRARILNRILPADLVKGQNPFHVRAGQPVSPARSVRLVTGQCIGKHRVKIQL